MLYPKENPLVWQFADLESGGTGNCNGQEVRGTVGIAGADQRQDTEQTALCGIVIAPDKWYNGGIGGIFIKIKKPFAG